MRWRSLAEHGGDEHHEAAHVVCVRHGGHRAPTIARRHGAAELNQQPCRGCRSIQRSAGDAAGKRMAALEDGRNEHEGNDENL